MQRSFRMFSHSVEGSLKSEMKPITRFFKRERARRVEDAEAVARRCQRLVKLPLLQPVAWTVTKVRAWLKLDARAWKMHRCCSFYRVSSSTLNTASSIAELFPSSKSLPVCWGFLTDMSNETDPRAPDLSEKPWIKSHQIWWLSVPLPRPVHNGIFCHSCAQVRFKLLAGKITSRISAKNYAEFDFHFAKLDRKFEPFTLMVI